MPAAFAQPPESWPWPTQQAAGAALGHRAGAPAPRTASFPPHAREPSADAELRGHAKRGVARQPSSPRAVRARLQAAPGPELTQAPAPAPVQAVVPMGDPRLCLFATRRCPGPVDSLVNLGAKVPVTPRDPPVLGQPLAPGWQSGAAPAAAGQEAGRQGPAPADPARPGDWAPSLVLPGLKDPFPISRTQEGEYLDPGENRIVSEGLPQAHHPGIAQVDGHRVNGAACTHMNGAHPQPSAAVPAQRPGAAPCRPLAGSRLASAVVSPQYAEQAGGEWHAGRWIGGRSQWANSFSDVSSVVADDDESFLRTPAQLRPLDSWVPQTPAEEEEPPPYEQHVRWLAPPSACTSSVLEPVQLAKLFKRGIGRGSGGCPYGYLQEGTQPVDSGIPEDVEFYLEGGEELSQSGRIPTPSRSQRHIGIQANRHSIDGHAARPSSPPTSQQQGAATRARLQSIIRCNGAPEADGTPSGGTSARSSIRNLQYPKVAPNAAAQAQAASGDQGPRGWEGRVAFSEALSEAVVDEFDELKRAWRLGTPESDPRVEKVAKELRKVATRAERACVIEALQPWAAAEDPTGLEVADEEERMQELEAESAALDERLASLRAAQADISQVKEAAPCETMSKLVAQLSALESSVASMAGAGSQEQLHECLMQLGCVDGWFQRAFDQLEEAERDLADREYEASQRALAQFPGEALDPQRELLRLR